MLDVLPNRYRSYSTTTSGSTVNRVNHYSNEIDVPSWTSEGGWYTRPVQGLSGLAALYTGATPRLDWQITNLHGDVVAMRLNGATGLTATYVTDEFGKSTTTTTPRYGYLDDARRSGDNPGGLINMGVRNYDPTTGRFLSTDPVYGGNANAYDYCHGDAVNCTDTTGEMSCSWTFKWKKRGSRAKGGWAFSYSWRCNFAHFESKYTASLILGYGGFVVGLGSTAIFTGIGFHLASSPQPSGSLPPPWATT